MEQALDAMSTHFNGKGAQFNRVFLKNITDCLNMWEDDISI